MKLSFVVRSVVLLIVIDRIQGYAVKFKFKITEPTPRTRTYITKQITDIHKIPLPPNHKIVKITKKEPRQIKSARGAEDNPSSPLNQIDQYVHAFAYYMTKFYSYVQDRVTELKKKNDWQCFHNRPARAYPVIDIKTWDVVPDEKSPLRNGVSFKIKCKKQWGLQDILF